MKSYIQQDSKDCGPTCLRNLASYYGVEFPIQLIREYCNMSREGVTLRGLSDGAKKLGFETLTAKITTDQLENGITLPCILLLNSKHFVLVLKYLPFSRKFIVLDPAVGKITYSETELRSNWIRTRNEIGAVGVAIQLSPNGNWDKNAVKGKHFVANVNDIIKFITPHKYTFLLIITGTILTMGLSFIMPFLSQLMVDVGILGKQEKIIGYLLFAQLMIVFSQMIIQYFQGWLSLHTNTIINVNLITSYLNKLVLATNRLFDLKTRGDILQRIGDYSRIKNFLMNNVIGIFFATGTFLAFSAILAIYNMLLFAIQIIGYGLLAVWIFSFMKFRKILDYRKFEKAAQLQNNTMQFIEGIVDIKTNNIERHLIWAWENLQVQTYRLNIKDLKISQIQSLGASCIINTTNIIVSFICADLVIKGNMSIGMMMSLSFIIGQIQGPMFSYISFLTSYQDAKISLDRLADIDSFVFQEKTNLCKITEFNHDITFNNVSFSYNGDMRHCALKKANINIPFGKTTAIIGNSGCGKSTILKLLLGLYPSINGNIFVGDHNLSEIDKKSWWKQVGAVMQDGFLFSDSIMNNITLWDEHSCKERVKEAIKIANLSEYINNLPAKIETQIGKDGIGLSQGQKQRILIARAIYQSPSLLLLDEPANSLDAHNEEYIMHNLLKHFQGKTIVIALHDLKTVNAVDHIVILEKGQVVEQGPYTELKEKGYFSH